MANVIEFYIPSDFQRKTKWIPPEQRGKVIEFVPISKSVLPASVPPVHAEASSQ
jgi:hypothetical protein